MHTIICGPIFFQMSTYYCLPSYCPNGHGYMDKSRTYFHEISQKAFTKVGPQNVIMIIKNDMMNDHIFITMN